MADREITDEDAVISSHLTVAEDTLKCCFTSTETVGLLGTGAQDGHFDFHTAPELCRKHFGTIAQL